MTVALSLENIVGELEASVPGSIEEVSEKDIWIDMNRIHEVCSFLKQAQDIELNFLVAISAVDYIEYFELVYHLQSIKHNHSLVIKSKCWGRDDISVSSVVDIWRGADFQEREIYDLMGISFTNHPNLKRIMLWEGFPGHPQRKDYFEPPR
jgi:NADH-quinone oxidoreductase subunit C